jgi:hypothetical protein
MLYQKQNLKTTQITQKQQKNKDGDKNKRHVLTQLPKKETKMIMSS